MKTFEINENGVCTNPIIVHEIYSDKKERLQIFAYTALIENQWRGSFCIFSLSFYSTGPLSKYSKGFETEFEALQYAMISIKNIIADKSNNETEENLLTKAKNILDQWQFKLKI
ncbi:hypothetical protein AB4865_10930 [Capnocytophaga sp. ARDL2]|uniref:hypothetical protein n=1 Tax=Capnocytophaga sp. ARDL2 TaxID=3238809 RepID=UPI0035588B3D